MSRYERVKCAIEKEVSIILHDYLKDPRIGFITVTRVDLSADLRLAKIYYSVLGDIKQKANTSKGLEHAGGFIRRMIAQRLNLKFTPEIFFKEDNSIEESIYLEQEIEKLKNKNGAQRNNPDNKK